jgi:hypothetical protein
MRDACPERAFRIGSEVRVGSSLGQLGQSPSDWRSAQPMAHPILFDPQIADVVRVLGHREADPADDLQAVPVEAAELRRIVRDQAESLDTEIGADLRTRAVVA